MRARKTRRTPIFVPPPVPKTITLEDVIKVQRNKIDISEIIKGQRFKIERKTPYHSVNVPPPPKPKTIDDVPNELLVEWSYKLFALMNLSWDYVDTILNICITQKLQETKELVRTVRLFKLEYDRFRQRTIDRLMERNEEGHGLRFEERFKDDFSRLLTGIEMDVNKLHLVPEQRELVVAVQQALTLMDAVKGYARWCDKQISSFGVWTCDCCMVQTEFLRLYPVVPQFAGDCYQPDITARKTTAAILVERLKGMELTDLLDEEEYRLVFKH